MDVCLPHAGSPEMTKKEAPYNILVKPSWPGHELNQYFLIQITAKDLALSDLEQAYFEGVFNKKV